MGLGFTAFNPERSSKLWGNDTSKGKQNSSFAATWGKDNGPLGFA
jgi:hypothetical protein